MWIDPENPRRMMLAADQGGVVTLNGGDSWSSWYNQPTGQLYRLAADNRFPYWIYSGQQDSGTVAIASRSDYGQLTFRDWHPVGGDERDGDIPDPRDPQVVYGAGLGGRGRGEGPREPATGRGGEAVQGASRIADHASIVHPATDNRAGPGRRPDRVTMTVWRKRAGNGHGTGGTRNCPVSTCCAPVTSVSRSSGTPTNTS